MKLSRSPAFHLAVAALLVALVACAGGVGPPLPGTVSGTVTLGEFNLAWQPYGGRDYVPGEVIVSFTSAVGAQGLSVLRAAGHELQHERSLNLSQTHLYRVVGLRTSSLRDDVTLALARELNARSDVAYAQPNYLSRPQQTNVPNDAQYAQQWHYPAINLPQAWTITTGSPNVVVAVLDTGMMFDANNAAISHSDLAGKVVGDYDFISDPAVAQDGDGRDGNGFDSADLDHGSHVGGTIAAATNNGTGVAGAGWDTSLLNVRVLGDFGSIEDINDGGLWAAGLPVAGVPNNPNPAKVLNLSLGGDGACSPFEQAGFDQIRQQGAIVVVAAGNENENVSQKSPASCNGVITVGATGPTGNRAEYSNFGRRVDVMGPGGDGGAQDNNNDGTPDGVLSTVDENGTSGYAWFDGTSMATPHVAGVVALLVAQKPDITPDEALTALRSTARQLDDPSCNGTSGNGLTSADCGAGLIDAFAALQSLGAAPPPPPAGAPLQFAPDPVAFGPQQTELQLTLTNTSNAAVGWQFLDFTVAGNNPGTVPANTLGTAAGANLQGNLDPAQSAQIGVTLDRSGLTQAGTYAMNMRFQIDGATEQSVLVRFGVAAQAPDTSNGFMDIIAIAIDDFSVVGSQESQNGLIQNFQFDVEPSDFFLDAWYDANQNGEIDSGDFAAFFPTDPADFLTVDEGEQLSNINLQMFELSDVPEGLLPRLHRLVELHSR